MKHATATLLVLMVLPLAACGGGGGGGSTDVGDQDPKDGAARLDEQRPMADRAGEQLGDALAVALGGTAETGPTEYRACSSAPVEGLEYYARFRIRDAEPAPTLQAATDAAAEAGWKVGDTSPAQGQLSESVALTSDGISARLTVDDGVIGWRTQTACVRVTPEEANKRVGPTS